MSPSILPFWTYFIYLFLVHNWFWIFKMKSVPTNFNAGLQCSLQCLFQPQFQPVATIIRPKARLSCPEYSFHRATFQQRGEQQSSLCRSQWSSLKFMFGSSRSIKAYRCGKDNLLMLHTSIKTYSLCYTRCSDVCNNIKVRSLLKHQDTTKQKLQTGVWTK